MGEEKPGGWGLRPAAARGTSDLAKRAILGVRKEAKENVCLCHLAPRRHLGKLRQRTRTRGCRRLSAVNPTPGGCTRLGQAPGSSPAPRLGRGRPGSAEVTEQPPNASTFAFPGPRPGLPARPPPPPPGRQPAPASPAPPIPRAPGPARPPAADAPSPPGPRPRPQARPPRAPHP